MDPLSKLIDGNMGTATCLLGLTQPENEPLMNRIIPVVLRLGIKGSDLYVLWSDISNKDYELMAYLCGSAPDKLLIEASSKQDYSGKHILAHFIANYSTQLKS